jgi:hypothetical protein
MNREEQLGATRREMLVTAGRYALLGGLAVAVTRLVIRDQSSRDANRCTGDFRCSRCVALGDCVLPEGVQARNAMQAQGL